MIRCFKLLVCVAAAALPALTASAQVVSAQPASTHSPVAYVYVSRPTHIDGFAVSSSGTLSPVPGSPFANISVSHLSVSKKYVFGAGDDGENIYTFAIESNGELKKVAEINVQKYNSGFEKGLTGLQTDAAGSTLYIQVQNSDDSQFLESFKIESNGELQFLGKADTGEPSDVVYLYPATVLGNDAFAYQVANADDDGVTSVFFNSYKRQSNGLLEFSERSTDVPNPENAADTYLTRALATSATDHLAVGFSAINSDGDTTGNAVLASYTADSHGKLTTASTYHNMPATELELVTVMSISPSGKLLAVGGSIPGCDDCGTPGFQVFHFNGSSPISHYTGLLQPADAFQQFGWDDNNHLFALSGGKLYVYDATTTSIQQASGSPYSIPEASSVIVAKP